MHLCNVVLGPRDNMIYFSFLSLVRFFLSLPRLTYKCAMQCGLGLICCLGMISVALQPSILAGPLWGKSNHLYLSCGVQENIYASLMIHTHTLRNPSLINCIHYKHTCSSWCIFVTSLQQTNHFACFALLSCRFECCFAVISVPNEEIVLPKDTIVVLLNGEWRRTPGYFELLMVLKQWVWRKAIKPRGKIDC